MKKIKEILIQHYSADPESEISLIRKGVDNDVYTFYDENNSKLIARVNKKDKVPSIEFESKLIRHLTEKKVPVASLVLTKTGKPFTMLNSKQAVACFEFIEGKTIDYGPDYKPKDNLVKQAGSALGKFHQATLNLNLKAKSKRTIYTELERAIKHKTSFLNTYKGGETFMKDVFNAYNKAKVVKSDWGIIHNDYNTSNILFDHEKLKAILDFDWACPGPLLMDVGYGAMSWSTAEKDTKPYQKAFDKFITNYNQSSPIKVQKNPNFYFWTAYSCLYLASGFLTNMLTENKYNITSVKQSHMYRRYLYYISKI